MGFLPNHTEFEEVFRRENISLADNKSAFVDFDRSTHYSSLKQLSECNGTQIGRIKLLEASRNQIEEMNPGTMCHIASETVMYHQHVYYFFGYSHLKLSRAMTSLKETGFIKMYYEYQEFVGNLKYSSGIRKRLIEEDKSRCVAFGMTDWKILSIFIVWIFLLGVGFLVFLLEFARAPILFQRLIETFRKNVIVKPYWLGIKRVVAHNTHLIYNKFLRFLSPNDMVQIF